MSLSNKEDKLSIVLNLCRKVNKSVFFCRERYSSKDYNLISYALKSLTNDFNESVLIESLEEIINQIHKEEIVAKTNTLVTVRKETGNTKKSFSFLGGSNLPSEV